MRKLFSQLKKFLAILLILINLTGPGSGFLPVFAQEATDSAQVEPSPTPTDVSTASPTPGPPPTTIPTPTPSQTSTELTPAPSQLLLPTPLPTLLLEETPAAAPSAYTKKSIAIRLISSSQIQPKDSLAVELLNTKNNPYSLQLTKDGQNQTFTIKRKYIGDSVIVIIEPLVAFSPGRYTLTVNDSTGNQSNVEFDWGRLAINTNQSSYLPGETAEIGMSVLDRKGSVVCNADLELRVTSDELGMNDLLSTNNGKILTNPDCQAHDAVSQPDYQTSYTVGQPGKYRIILTSQAGNDRYSVEDSFEVTGNPKVEIERNAPTRILPNNSYPVSLTIKANEDFQGKIIETLPETFQVASESASSESRLFDVIEKVSLTETKQKLIGSEPVDLRLPFDGNYPINLEFGEQPDDPGLQAEYEQFGAVGHDGMDFSLPEGTLVLAVDEGEVMQAGDGGYGLTVVIKHRWGNSYYGHLSETKLTVGETVKQGDQIGLSGTTGFSTGPHLHFSLLPNSPDFNNGYAGKIDPGPYLGVSKNFVSQTVQQLIWNVSLVKGQTINLGYQFDATADSSQVYLIGPLTLITQSGQLTFEENSRWQLLVDDVDTNGFSQKILGQYHKKLKINKIKENGNAMLNFNASDHPLFEIDLTSGKYDDLWKKTRSKRKQAIKSEIKHQARENIDSMTTEIEFDETAKTLSVLPAVTNDFYPGRYQLTVEIPTTNGSVDISQDFTWGVLAINTNKSILTPGEEVKLGMAVLDDFGRTKCLTTDTTPATGDPAFETAKLWLTITSPSGATTELSTDNGQIFDSGKCGIHSVTNEADFQARFVANEIGLYQLNLEGENINGRRSITDQFQVQASPAFDVERTSVPTRIYPAAVYTNTITVRANQDFTGEIKEYLPASFVVSDTQAVVEDNPSTKQKILTWTVILNQGDSIDLTYSFDAPNDSPEFYLLGPLELVSLDQLVLFEEARLWQLASDATLTWDGGATGSGAANWSKGTPTCANWSSDACPTSADDLVFDGVASKGNDDNTWDSSATSTANSLNYQSGYTGASIITCPSASCTITNAFNWVSGTGTLTFTGSLALSVGAGVQMTSTATFTPNTSTLTMTGTGTLYTGKTLYNFTVNGSGNTVTVTAAAFPTVSNVLTIGASGDNNNDTMTFQNSGAYLTSGTAGTITIYGSGTDTISGAGKLIVQNSNLSANGTISSNVKFDTTNGNITMPARIYGGEIEIYHNSSGTPRSVTMDSGTHDISGGITIDNAFSGTELTLNGSNNPTVNLTGYLRGWTSGGNNNITTGTGTWTVSGFVTFSDIATFTATTGNLFKMNGSVKQLTSAGESFYDFEVSGGSITAQDTTTITSNLTVSGGTFASGANNLTVGSTGFANSGSIKVASGATISQSASATTTVYSSASGSNCIGANSSNCATGTAGTIGFYNLTIGDLSTTFTTSINGGVAPTVTVGNTLIITTNATLSASGIINVARDWFKYPLGNFTANSSTVNLNSGGTSQTISGVNTFYTLSAIGTSARTILFPWGSTTTITNSLTLTGAASQLLTLDPSEAAYVWTIDPPPSSVSVSYVTVNYSTATECIYASNSSGSNTILWDFTGATCGPVTGPTNDQLMRHGGWFNSSGVEQSFTF